MGLELESFIAILFIPVAYVTYWLWRNGQAIKSLNETIKRLEERKADD